MLTGDVLFLALFILLPICLTVLAFKSKVAWILFPVIVLWLLLAIHCNTMIRAEWDIFHILRVMSIAMTVTSAIMIFAVAALNRKPEDLMGGEQNDIDIWREQRDSHRQRVGERKNLRQR